MTRERDRRSLGNLAARHLSAKARFLLTVEQTDQCWLWHGTMYGNGYGMFSVKGQQRLAHRTSYEMFVGAIASDAEVMHTCHNRRCVNPKHLRLGTHAENQRQMAERGSVKGVRNGAARLSDCDVAAIRAMRASGATLRSIGAKYGIAEATVCNIARRKSWRHVR